MIRAEGLVKDFATGPLRAVDGLSFEVQPGEIYGLLGPNGAGKTTAMRLLSALLRPTAGTATVAGYSVVDAPDQVRARIGILTEVPGLYARLTPAEYLDFYAQLYGLDRAPVRAAVLRAHGQDGSVRAPDDGVARPGRPGGARGPGHVCCPHGQLTQP